MDPQAISKAEIRLRAAQAAVARMPSNKSYEDFCADWYTFLTATKNIYTMLEQGAKTTPKSRQWFGAKKVERKNDPLLQYLFQARDDEEHGLGQATQLAPGQTSVQIKSGGLMLRPATPSDPKGRLFVLGEDQEITEQMRKRGPYVIESTDGGEHAIVRIPAHPRLRTVHGRGGIPYPPPTLHKGSPIADLGPIRVAEFGLAHLSALIAEAKEI